MSNIVKIGAVETPKERNDIIAQFKQLFISKSHYSGFKLEEATLDGFISNCNLACVTENNDRKSESKPIKALNVMFFDYDGTPDDLNAVLKRLNGSNQSFLAYPSPSYKNKLEEGYARYRVAVPCEDGLTVDNYRLNCLSFALEHGMKWESELWDSSTLGIKQVIYPPLMKGVREPKKAKKKPKNMTRQDVMGNLIFHYGETWQTQELFTDNEKLELDETLPKQKDENGNEINRDNIRYIPFKSDTMLYHNGLEIGSFEECVGKAVFEEEVRCDCPWEHSDHSKEPHDYAYFDNKGMLHCRNAHENLRGVSEDSWQGYEVNPNFDEKNKLYRLPSGKYLITSDGKLINNGIAPQAIKGFAKRFDLTYIDDKNKEQLVEAEHINDISVGVDYFTDTEYKATVNDKMVLDVIHNPVRGWDKNPNLNSDIIDDFTNKVMQGKLNDIIKLMFLSLKFKEDKLIRLLIFGGSNKGKTKLTELLGASVMKFSDFDVCMNPSNSRQFSVKKYNEINESGILCIDETNNSIPNSIKDMGVVSEVQVIGEGGGNPLNTNFIFLTSTHDEILDDLNEEWENRLMSIDLGDDGYNAITSPVALKYYGEYEKQCELYIKKRALEILDSDYSINDLREIQEKYKFDSTSNGRGELLDSVKEIVSNGMLKSVDGIIEENGHYYVQQKSAVKKYIKNILEFEGGNFIDNKGNALKKLYDYFIAGGRKGFREDGHSSPVNYYKIQNISIDIEEDELFDL